MGDFSIPRGVRVACEGFLSKQSKWIKSWRVRYFTLAGNQLYFSAEKGGEPHGVIDLSRCLTVKSADDKAKKAHSFEVSTTTDTFLLVAESDAQKDAWIGAIGRSIVQGSRGAFIREGEEDED